MIKRILDTNICIYIAQQNSIDITHKFSTYRKGELAISAITWAEMCCGNNKKGEIALNKLANFWQILAFCKKSAEMYAQLTMKHFKRKANFDRLIAAQAIALNITLVTNNINDFVIYEDDGLQLENWI